MENIEQELTRETVSTQQPVLREREIAKVTLIGSVVNLVLVIFKFLAGIFGHSSAMIADAIHSLSDLLSDFILLCCLKISGRPNDRTHNYGYGKFETMATILIAVCLLATGLGLLWDGIADLKNYFAGQPLPMPNMLAFWAAVISLLSKEALYQYTIQVAKKTDSGALRANAWHHRSDAISSLATLGGVGVPIFMGDSWVILDPIAACIISLFIVAMAYTLGRPALDELMEKALPGREQEEIVDVIVSTPEIRGFHHLRTRRVGHARAVEMHIFLDGDMSLNRAHAIASEIEKNIRASLGPDTYVSVHMEPKEAPARPG